MKDSNKALLFVSIAVLSWSTVATAFKIALRHYSLFELIFVSALTAVAIFALVITFQKKWNLLKTINRKELASFAFIGLLNPAIYYIILFKSYDLLPAQIAQPINYFWPILLVILMAIFTKQRIAGYKFIGMVISFAGVVLISLGTETFAGVKLSKLGIFLAFMSAFFWATFWIINKRNQHVDGIVALFLSFFFGSVYLLIISIFISVNLNSIQGLLSSIYVGLFEMAVPFIFFGLALRKTNNPALVNQLCYLSPFISLFIINQVLKETIFPTTYIGLFLIVAGILLNEMLSKRKTVNA